MYKPSSRLSRGSVMNLSRTDLCESSLLGKRQSGSANLIIIIVLVALAVIGAGLFVWSRQDDKSDKAETTSDSTIVTTPKIAEKEENTTETILDVELTLQRSGDEDLLPSETPSTFIEYMATKLNDFDCDFVAVPTGGYSITKISPRFVAGGIGCEGGAGIVWYLTTVGWEELGFQSYVPCSELVELAIPSEFIETCYDDSVATEDIIANPNGPLN